MPPVAMVDPWVARVGESATRPAVKGGMGDYANKTVPKPGLLASEPAGTQLDQSSGFAAMPTLTGPTYSAPKKTLSWLPAPPELAPAGAAGAADADAAAGAAGTAATPKNPGPAVTAPASPASKVQKPSYLARVQSSLSGRRSSRKDEDADQSPRPARLTKRSLEAHNLAQAQQPSGVLRVLGASPTVAAAVAPPQQSQQAAASKEVPSAAAERLLEAQNEALAGILANVRTAGPRYVKSGHYAWWVWPTTKEGLNDARRTAVLNASDVAYVLGGPAAGVWTQLLDAFAQLLESRRDRRCFPTIDHGRIDYFCIEWSSPEYREAMKDAPRFAKAVERFASAWRELK